MSQPNPNLTQQENEELLKRKIQEYRNNINRYVGLAQHPMNQVETPTRGVPQNFGIMFKNGREAKAEIR